MIKGVHQIALTKHNTQIRQLVLTGGGGDIILLKTDYDVINNDRQRFSNKTYAVAPMKEHICTDIKSDKGSCAL